MLLSNFSAACRNTNGLLASGNAGFYPLSNYPTQGTHYINTSGGWYVDVGLGDTPVDIDDYKLDDSCFMDNSDLLTWITTVIYSGSPYIKWVATFYKNETNNPVTIKEIGMFTKTQSVSSASNPNVNFMIARKVLDTPITINPNEVKSFSYGIDIAS